MAKSKKTTGKNSQATAASADDTMVGLKPYVFHGLDLQVSRTGSGEATCDCPFCGRQGKFSVNATSGLWRCLVCNTGSNNGKVNRGGNIITFLRELWRISDEATTDYTELATNRGLIDPGTLIHWGVVRSTITNEWLVPGYDYEGKIYQLYRYATMDGKKRLLATTGVGHYLLGTHLYKPYKDEVFLLEGPWDAMALWEMLANIKRTDDGEFTITSNSALSLLTQANIMAVPGSGTFHDSWGKYMANKRVYLCFDNDHPRVHPVTKQPIEPAGLLGMKRVSELLAKHPQYHPKEVCYLKWGENGKDYDETLPSGYDVRDLLKSGGKTYQARIKPVATLLDHITPISADWIQGRTLSSQSSGQLDLEMLTCHDWATLVNSWKKAMKWIPGLDHALSAMLATVVSTPAASDQLWIKVIGPPSCGKTTLAEALSVNKKYIEALSTIRGFHSGWRSDEGEEEDNGLLARIKGKTLITKDGDTLVQSPQLSKILSEARDVYDGTTRSHYLNKMGKNHEYFRATWIICGTKSLRRLDKSELGERFLDVVIMEDIDNELEDEIGWRAANAMSQAMKIDTTKDSANTDSLEKIEARRLTGGYVQYLRENASRLLAAVSFPRDALIQCMDLGKFVARLRARLGEHEDDIGGREISARLIGQHVRAATCLAVVLNKTEVDNEVIKRVAKIALDTARGVTFRITQELAKLSRPTGELSTTGTDDTGKTRKDSDGTSSQSLALVMGTTTEKINKLLRFLRQIKVIEFYHKQTVRGFTGKPLWRLTQEMSRLYNKVMFIADKNNLEVTPDAGVQEVDAV